jgi:hypothetical protein
LAEPGHAIERQVQERFARSARKYVESSMLAARKPTSDGS